MWQRVICGMNQAIVVQPASIRLVSRWLNAVLDLRKNRGLLPQKSNDISNEGRVFLSIQLEDGRK